MVVSIGCKFCVQKTIVRQPLCWVLKQIFKICSWNHHQIYKSFLLMQTHRNKGLGNSIHSHEVVQFDENTRAKPEPRVSLCLPGGNTSTCNELHSAPQHGKFNFLLATCLSLSFLFYWIIVLWCTVSTVVQVVCHFILLDLLLERKWSWKLDFLMGQTA